MLQGALFSVLPMHELRAGTANAQCAGRWVRAARDQPAFVCPGMKGTVGVLETFGTQSEPRGGFGYFLTGGKVA